MTCDIQGCRKKERTFFELDTSGFHCRYENVVCICDEHREIVIRRAMTIWREQNNRKVEVKELLDKVPGKNKWTIKEN